MSAPADHECCLHIEAPHSGCCHHERLPGWRVLVCGSRDWQDLVIVWAVLDGIRVSAPRRPMVVIHGDAAGADAAAKHWSEHHEVESESYPAYWGMHGKAAGPIRNQQMLEDGQPNMVVAFAHDLSRSWGTADMVRKAQAAGVKPVYVIARADKTSERGAR